MQARMSVCYNIVVTILPLVVYIPYGMHACINHHAVQGVNCTCTCPTMHVIQVENLHGIETASKCNFTELIRDFI